MPKLQQNGNAGGRGRRARGARVSTSLAEINVVPLVDVMLVLLIIFMVTAPMMTQGLAVNLPQARRATPVTAQPIYITIPSTFAKDRIVQIGNDEVRVEILQERMKQMMLEHSDKSVFVRSDAAVTMQDFMAVTDKLKEGGVEKVNISTRPVER
ncbi:MAG: protein TolR [Acidobacteria bacterium]|nr:MAG: protein TolR [Acidobacteriota bacterium]